VHAEWAQAAALKEAVSERNTNTKTVLLKCFLAIEETSSQVASGGGAQRRRRCEGLEDDDVEIDR